MSELILLGDISGLDQLMKSRASTLASATLGRRSRDRGCPQHVKDRATPRCVFHVSPDGLPAMAFGLVAAAVSYLGVRLSIATWVLGHTIHLRAVVIRMVGASVRAQSGADGLLAPPRRHAAGTRFDASPCVIGAGIAASCVGRISVLVRHCFRFRCSRRCAAPRDAIKIWAILEGSLDQCASPPCPGHRHVTLIGLCDRREAFGGQ